VRVRVRLRALLEQARDPDFQRAAARLGAREYRTLAVDSARVVMPVQGYERLPLVLVPALVFLPKLLPEAE
jgi:hypothetical protein